MTKVQWLHSTFDSHPSIPAHRSGLLGTRPRKKFLYFSQFIEIYIPNLVEMFTGLSIGKSHLFGSTRIEGGAPGNPAPHKPRNIIIIQHREETLPIEIKGEPLYHERGCSRFTFFLNSFKKIG